MCWHPTSEIRGGAHMGISECIDTILNWTVKSGPVPLAMVFHNLLSCKDLVSVPLAVVFHNMSYHVKILNLVSVPLAIVFHSVFCHCEDINPCCIATGGSVSQCALPDEDATPCCHVKMLHHVTGHRQYIVPQSVLPCEAATPCYSPRAIIYCSTLCPATWRH